MATYTSNYGWTKPSGSDNVDISVLNNNLDDQDSTIHDAFLNMAPPFSESSTYAVDDVVLYTTGLYKCHTAVTTPGSWTGSTNWQVHKLSEGGSGGGGTSNYNDLTNKPSINSVELSGNKTTGDLGINADNVMMSDGETSVEDALDGLQKTTITFTTTDYTKLQNNCVAKKQGEVVSLQFKGFKNLTADTYNDLFTLPEAYRPSAELVFNIIPSIATFTICRMRILVNGKVQVYPYGSTAATYAVNAEDIVTYIK